MEEFESCLLPVRPVLERYVRFRLRDSSDWEDVLQDVYTLGYLRFSQLRSREAFRGWILAIARNQCTEYYRRKSRKQEIPMEELPESELYCRCGIVYPAVEDTMEQLTARDREILQLAYWQELSGAEIAQELDIPLGTVKSRLHTAREHFRKQYPYPPRKTKGEEKMGVFPKIMPSYIIERVQDEPFACRWEEMQGWLIVPRLGERLSWAMYDFPERTCTSWTKLAVVGKAEVHGIEGVEITATQYGQGDDRDPGFEDSMERRFVAQLTETHSRYLAESHSENGVRKYFTFLDGDAFLNNWGFGPDNIGNEVNLSPKGLLHREGDAVVSPQLREVLDVVGRYAVTINGKQYDTVCVMDIEFYNESVVSEQYVDQHGRTVLWRRFNRDDWALDRFGGRLWSERFPENEQITVNGETYVHWYDCVSDYIL